MTAETKTQSIIRSAFCLPGILPGSNDIIYHARTIWLFTRSDLKTIVGPSALFAVSNAIALCRDLTSLTRAPLVVFWIWMNLLPFAIGNQRSPDAVAEDLINKPWRPMPSNRLSRNQARVLMYIGYACAVLGASQLGGLKQCLTLIALGTWYNDFGGADYNSVVRNFINACGYLCFVSGAFEIAMSRSGWTVFDDHRILTWMMILGGIIQTTVHAQDLPDQEGDALRGRKTVPLEMGDVPARIAIFFGLPIWTLVCSHFWTPHWAVTVLHAVLSIVVAWRTLNLRSVKQDKKTFKLWNLWIGGVYILPLCAAWSSLNL